MPLLIGGYYQAWINGPTLFDHPCDVGRFYKFVKACLRYSRGKVHGSWLKYFLERDLPNIYKDPEYVEKYISKAVSLFDTLMDFGRTPFSYCRYKRTN